MFLSMTQIAQIYPCNTNVLWINFCRIDVSNRLNGNLWILHKRVILHIAMHLVSGWLSNHTQKCIQYVIQNRFRITVTPSASASIGNFIQRYFCEQRS